MRIDNNEIAYGDITSIAGNIWQFAFSIITNPASEIRPSTRHSDSPYDIISYGDSDIYVVRLATVGQDHFPVPVTDRTFEFDVFDPGSGASAHYALDLKSLNLLFY